MNKTKTPARSSTTPDLLPSKLILAKGCRDKQPDAIRLAVVDRYPVIREGVSRMLAEVPDILLVAEANTTEGLIDILSQQSVNVLLIDPEFGRLSTQNMLKTMSHRLPKLRIILFVTACRDCDIDLAMQIGVSGYLLKSTETLGLVTTIRQAANNSTCYCDEAIARMAACDARRNQGYPVSKLATLSDRENNLLRLLSKGLAIKEIAFKLSLSAKTVDNHRTRIMGKLNIHNRVALCRFAVREGIITP